MPLVFFHGAGGLLADNPFLDQLAARYHVFAPELPGYGESTGEELLEDMLDFTLHGWDVVAALGLTRPHLVGHSMGGMIAAEMAAIAPGDLDKLVLVAAAGLWIEEHPIPDIFALLPGQLIELLFQDPVKGQALLTGGADFSDMEVFKEFYLGQQRRLAMAGKILFPIPNRRVSKRLYRRDREDPGPLGRGRQADRPRLRRALEPADPGRDRRDRCRTPGTCCRTSSPPPSSARSPGSSDERSPGRRLDRPAAQAARGPPPPDRRGILRGRHDAAGLPPRGPAPLPARPRPHRAPRRGGGARRAPRTLLVVTGKDVAHLAPMPVNRLMPDMRVPPASDPGREPGPRGRHAGGRGGGRGRVRGLRRARSHRRGLRAPARPGRARGGPRAAALPLLFSGIDGNRVLTRMHPRGRRARGAFAPRPTWCRCAWRRTASPRWRWSRARSWPPSTASPPS